MIHTGVCALGVSAHNRSRVRVRPGGSIILPSGRLGAIRILSERAVQIRAPGTSAFRHLRLLAPLFISIATGLRRRTDARTRRNVDVSKHVTAYAFSWCLLLTDSASLCWTGKWPDRPGPGLRFAIPRVSADPGRSSTQTRAAGPPRCCRTSPPFPPFLSFVSISTVRLSPRT